MKTKIKNNGLICNLTADSYESHRGLELRYGANKSGLSEQHYKAVFDSMDSMIMVLDKNGTIIDANNQLVEFTGFNKNKLLGEKITVLSGIIERQDIDRALDNSKKKLVGLEVANYEIEAVRPDNQHVSLEVFTRPLQHAGKIIGDLIVLKDITERVHIQRLLSESEYKFRILAEESPNLIFISKNNSLAYINRKFTEVMEYRHEELYADGFDFLNLVNDECRQQLVSISNEYRDEYNSRLVECTFITKSGKHLETILITKAITYSDGPATLGVITDITQLRAAQSLSRAVLNSPTIGIYIIQKGRFKMVNPAFRNLADRTENELMQIDPMEIVFPEDQVIVRENAIKMLKGELAGPYEFRYVRKNGEVRWVAEQVVPIIYQGERATLGSFIDIHERRQIESEVKESYKKLQRTVEGAIEAIATIAETRDPYTAGHQRRVAQLASTIAREMKLSEEQVSKIRIAGLLHDIGKVAVPSELLSKPGELTDIEFDLIKTHPQLGKEILKTMELPWVICPIVLQHHERMDGSGYPRGLTGEEISLEARILAVADVVEAMSSHRPYRPSLGLEAALEEISKNKGKLYDAEVVDVCLALFREKGFKYE
jgi:PAS domain S-box-containing protein/putative nucleotidyltransferase with HDIG domain